MGNGRIVLGGRLEIVLSNRSTLEQARGESIPGNPAVAHLIRNGE